MSQPDWKYLDNLGDANPLDHGGFFVFEDKTGEYPPEAEILEVPEDEDGEYTVYRFPLEPCTFVNGVLSDNSYHPDHPAWFAGDIEGVARSMGNGVSAEELIDCLCSRKTLERADAWRDLVAYYGPQSFDSYPLTLTREEANARYADIGFGELSEKLKAVRHLKREVNSALLRLENSETSDEYAAFYMWGEMSALRSVLTMLDRFDEHSV